MKKLFKSILLFAVVLCSLAIFNKNVKAENEKDIVIVIDPGHGGEDPGKIGTTGVYESKCNYEIAAAIKEELGKYSGVKVYLTREEDAWVSNMGRAMVAANLKADFLISVHNNSADNTDSSGCLAFKSLNQYYSASTEDMCQKILNNLSALGITNLGVQTRVSTTYDYEDYYTLIGEGVRAGVPSIIVEHCFLSTPGDAALVSNPDGSLKLDMLKQMGIADAKGIVEYFHLMENTIPTDSQSSITLEKGYSVRAITMNMATGIWNSSNQSVAIVDETGLVTAVGSGSAKIVCQVADGTEQSFEINVKDSKAIALVGAIDPTFYRSKAEFAALDTANIFAEVIYSDGTVKKVIPDSFGTINYEKIGIQDVDITYNGMKGKVRVCQEIEGYVPEVTLPAPEEETSGSEEESFGPSMEVPSENIPTEEVTTLAPAGSNTDKTPSKAKTFFVKLLKFLLVVIILCVVGIGFVFLENNIRYKKKNGRNK